MKLLWNSYFRMVHISNKITARYKVYFSTCASFTNQRVPLRCPTNFINVRVHDFMSQRFRAAVNRKRKSQARLHVARWSSQSVNIAFSLALFNRVRYNYMLWKSDHDTSFPRRYRHERRDCDVYNIYRYAIFVNSSFTFTRNNETNNTRNIIFAVTTIRRDAVEVTRWIRKWIRRLITGRTKDTPLRVTEGLLH